ncbi:hypothetical protein JYU34_020041, partial [Plutella xylostella]
ELNLTLILSSCNLNPPGVGVESTAIQSRTPNYTGSKSNIAGPDPPSEPDPRPGAVADCAGVTPPGRTSVISSLEDVDLIMFELAILVGR